MNPLPPQAYTKDTLVKAFQWIQLQGPDIKGLASTPDVLVSLYLKAKLQGEAVLERPSIQNFKNELKNLAGQLGEFAPAQELLNERAFDATYAKAPSAEATSTFDRTQQATPVGQHSMQFHSAPQTAQYQPTPAQPTPSRAFQTPPAPPQYHFQAPPAAPTPSAAPVASASTVTTASPSVAPAPPTAALSANGLDEKSLALVREVRELSNLQSDLDALRLLISVGHKHVKQLLR